MNRLSWDRSQLLDATIAVGLMAVGWYEVLVEPLAEDVIGGPTWMNLLAITAGTLPLAVRRRAPLPVALVVYAVLAVRALAAEPLELYPTFLAALIATYTVASYAPLRDALLSAAFSALSISVLVVQGSGNDAAPDPLASAILFGTVWLVGRVVGVRNERARQLHASRDLHAAQAVTAERERIARELHDAVSHSLAGIVMQSGGARNILASDPERAAASLEAIEQTARRGLEEMRQLLGLLGAPDAALAPQPGLDRLGPLVAELQDAGLAVELEMDVGPRADRRPVPAAVGTSVYRIVQEALTNVMKHAGPCSVSVRVAATAEAVEVEVRDDGAGASTPAGGEGRGLAGMRERALLLGGTFAAGPSSDGFRIHASLPL